MARLICLSIPEVTPESDTAVFWNRTIKRRTAKWLYGLASGFIGTLAGTLESTIVLMIAVPETFNIHHMAETLWLSLIIGALQGLKVACAYLVKSPLPGPTGDTEPDASGRLKTLG